MRSYRPGLAIVAVLTVALAGCATAAAPSWTYPPPAAAASQAPAAAASQAPVAAASGSVASAPGKLSREAFELGFRPSMPSVPAAGTYAVEFHNTGTTLHDVTF